MDKATFHRLKNRAEAQRQELIAYVAGLLPAHATVTIEDSAIVAELDGRSLAIPFRAITPETFRYAWRQIVAWYPAAREVEGGDLIFMWNPHKEIIEESGK